MTTDPEVTIRAAATIEEVSALRTAWEKLQSHPNSDLDFYLATLQSLEGVLRPHVLVLSRKGTPESILVGRIEDTVLSAKIGYKLVQHSRVRRLTVIYGGFLGDFCIANATAMMAMLVKALSDGEADILWFNSLRSDSPMYEALKGASRHLFADHFEEVGLHWKAQLVGQYSEFLSGLSSKTRNNLRRHSSRLLKAYGNNMKIKCFQFPSDLDRIMEDTEHVASKTYHRSLGVGFDNNAETRRLLTLELERGWFRGYILYINEIPCAFWNGLLYGRTFFTGTTGGDPSYREYGLGTFLLTKVFEDLCDSGDVDGVDFGLGDAQYKREFCDQCWEEASLLVFAPTLRGLILNLVRTPVILADRIGRWALEKTNLTQRVKRAWRLRA